MLDISKLEHDALVALSSMDDFARMECGVDAIGARGVLENFISVMVTQLEAAEKDAARFRWLTGTTPENEAYNETHANWPSGKLADCVDAAMKGGAA